MADTGRFGERLSSLGAVKPGCNFASIQSMDFSAQDGSFRPEMVANQTLVEHGPTFPTARRRLLFENIDLQLHRATKQCIPCGANASDPT